MGRTFIRQDLQIQSSQTYNATLPPGAALQSNAGTIEDDLNAVRSQLNRFLDATLGGSWTDDVFTTPDGKKRSIKQLNVGLAGIETKPWLSRVQVLAPITVPAGQNYVLLSAAGNQTPVIPLAYGASTSGALVAKSANSGAPFAGHELTAVAGTVATSPKNLVRVRYATGGQVIESNDLDIMGLLQVESTAVDGETINDTAGGNRAKISFVRINYGSGSLEAVPAADIAGKTLQYVYIQRQTLGTLPEQATLGDGTFTDNIGDLDVTLTRATANQAGPVVVPTNLSWQVATGSSFKVQDAGGLRDILALGAASGANSATLSPDSLLINTTTPPVSKQGVTVGQAAQAINVGVTAGRVDSAGPLTVAATGTGALSLTGGSTLSLKDGFQAGSTWTTTSIPLSASTAEWSAYKTAVGEKSLLGGIVAASVKGNRSKVYAVVTAASIPAGANVTGVGAGSNLDAPLFNYSGLNFLGLNLYVNGQLLRPGANASSGMDYWPGVSATNGDVQFAFELRGANAQPDVITMEVFSSPLYPA